MLKRYMATPEQGIHEIDGLQKGCWVNVVAPTDEERAWLLEELDIAPEFLRSALDDEERSHLDYDDDTGQSLVTIDCPYVEDRNESEDTSIIQYDTHPLSFLILPRQDVLVTVSLRDNDVVDLFLSGRMKGLNTNLRTRTLLQMMLRIAQRYLSCLRSIDRQFRENERVLRETMRNKELIRMLGFEKSLVYFSTSLQSVEATLTKIRQGRAIKLYEDDLDLLDDVFIEIRQAIEMCSITATILNGTTDAFSSVINNNLNFTMRTLTVITIVLSIPTIVFSFYGMNVGLPFASSWVVPICIALVLVVVCMIFFYFSHMIRR